MDDEIFPIKSIGEIMATLPKTFNDSNYRRGYFHGYYAALEDVEGQHKKVLSNLHRFLDEDLQRWRYENVDQMIGPPDFKG